MDETTGEGRCPTLTRVITMEILLPRRSVITGPYSSVQSLNVELILEKQNQPKTREDMQDGLT